MGIVVIGDVFIDIKDIPHPLIFRREETPEQSCRFMEE